MVFRVIINQASNTPTIVYIKFDDPNAGKELVHNYPIPFARENNVVLIEPVSARIKVRPGKASSPEIQTVQFLVKQRAFNYRQVYVGLSCATSLQGLFLF